MGYGKCWKVPKSTLEALIENADSNNNCLIEVWSDTSGEIEDCELWLKLASGWSDMVPIQPPVDPNT